MKREFACRHIVVNCIANDKKNIELGGPDYIGYDFYVKKEKSKEMFEFIEEVLKKTGTPVKSIYFGDISVKFEDSVSTKAFIEKAIGFNAAKIPSEMFKKVPELEM